VFTGTATAFGSEFSRLAKNWVFIYRRGARRTEIGLGGYPARKSFPASATNGRRSPTSLENGL
jgi:hypothetical protein